jgi:hypothetical protein
MDGEDVLDVCPNGLSKTATNHSQDKVYPK